MPVTGEQTFAISMDGSPTWKVSQGRLKQVEGHWFVKLRALDQSLLQLVVHDPSGEKQF